MKIHRFTAILDRSPDFDQTDALYGKIDDATIACCDGVGEMLFHREAETLEQAMQTAVVQIQAAGFGVDHLEVETDAVCV